MKTVRVRVFVSVAPGEGYLAYASQYENEEIIKEKCGHAEGYDAGYWIEADLPLPNQATEIVATVTRAE